MFALLFLLLPIAAASGWYAHYHSIKHNKPAKLNNFSQHYFLGLNYLLNEQTDKAVDVFIKVLEVDSETVEIHLALGNLFRRRGEVDRAIRLHQNLIARPQLAKEHRIKALLALGQDYLKAGVLDRAERLFLEVSESDNFADKSLHYLIDVYQQQKNWQQAITTARKYAAIAKESMATHIAHYYCELAESLLTHNQREACQYLNKALKVDPKCVRASMLEAESMASVGDYKTAIKLYKRIKSQDPDYLSEVIVPLINCSKKLDRETELIAYLTECLKEHPRISIILALTDHIQQMQGGQAASDFIVQQLHLHPSLRGLQRLIELNIAAADHRAQENLTILKKITADLLISKPIYRCNNCGLQGKILYWQCPSCKHWSSVKPIHGLEGD